MKECDKEHLLNDMWEYIEQVAPMMKRLKLYDKETEDLLTTTSTSENEDFWDLFAEEVLQCVEDGDLNIIEVR